MNIRKLLVLSLLSGCLMVMNTQNALAVKPLLAKELASECTAYPADAQFCIRYIQGFIEGAIATDTQVMRNVETEQSFTERAIRTRKPARTDDERAARYAEFCIDEQVPLGDVVTKVVTNLRNHKNMKDDLLARTVVYASLRENFSCKKSSP